MLLLSKILSFKGSIPMTEFVAPINGRDYADPDVHAACKEIREKLGIQESSRLPDAVLFAVYGNALRQLGSEAIHNIQYNNRVGFYSFLRDDDGNIERQYNFNFSVGRWTSHEPLDIENSTLRLATFFKTLLDKETIPEHRRYVATALQYLEDGDIDRAFDTYMDMKWIDLKLRVAIAHVVLHAQDINLLTIKYDPASKKLIGLRPLDKKICRFIFNPLNPGLSFWEAA
jgi:hypothetical protein